MKGGRAQYRRVRRKKNKIQIVLKGIGKWSKGKRGVKKEQRDDRKRARKEGR